MKKMMMAMLALCAFVSPNVKAEQMTYEYVTMTTDHGKTTMKLLPEYAPVTVQAFKERVSEGFYDGIYFHRVIPGFVAQGGDPALVGRERVDYTLPPEFSQEIDHKRGSVAMARTSDPNSASTQFYISYGAQPHLDGQYTIFAEVVDGMHAVDNIEQGDKIVKMEMAPNFKE